jgi:hypothetical protein
VVSHYEAPHIALPMMGFMAPASIFEDELLRFDTFTSAETARQYLD